MPWKEKPCDVLVVTCGPWVVALQMARPYLCGKFDGDVPALNNWKFSHILALMKFYKKNLNLIFVFNFEFNTRIKTF